jgi:hypothetical protein
LFTQALLNHLKRLGVHEFEWLTYKRLVNTLKVSQRYTLGLSFQPSADIVSASTLVAKVPAPTVTSSERQRQIGPIYQGSGTLMACTFWKQVRLAVTHLALSSTFTTRMRYLS